MGDFQLYYLVIDADIYHSIKKIGKLSSLFKWEDVISAEMEYVISAV